MNTLPRCVVAARRRPIQVVLDEALRAALLGLVAAWGAAELLLAMQGY